MPSVNAIFRAATAFLLCLNVGLAAAGTADVKTSDGSQMQFEYRGDDQLRVNMQQEGSYLLVTGEQVYVVSNSGGQVMVVDLAQTMSMFGSMAQAASPSAVQGKLVSLKATGAVETIAGISGEVYAVRYIDHEGKEQSSELVLADDPRAVDFQRAMFTMADSMARAAGKEVQGAQDIQQKLLSMNKGTLRFGQDMSVTAISDKSVDASRFVLPAQPTDLSALQGISGGGQSDEENSSVGGLISSMFGSKAERQQERAEDQAESEADKQTDEVMDKALGKAFGKLFGK